MNSIIKKVSVFAACCAVLSMISVYACAASLPYNTSSYKNLADIDNHLASKKTISANTRPTVGTGGAVINITKTTGKVTASKLFPYHVSVGDLTANLPASTIRRIQVGPHSTNQRIEGSVTYSVN